MVAALTKTTNKNVPITSIFGSISIPSNFISDEKPTIPAEPIGIETVSFLTDINLLFDGMVYKLC